MRHIIQRRDLTRNGFRNRGGQTGALLATGACAQLFPDSVQSVCPRLQHARVRETPCEIE